MSSRQVKIEKEEEKIIYWVPLPILRVGEEEGQKSKEGSKEIKIENQGFRNKQDGDGMFPRKRKSDFHQ